MISQADETVIEKVNIVIMKLQPTWHQSYQVTLQGEDHSPLQFSNDQCSHLKRLQIVHLSL